MPILHGKRIFYIEDDPKNRAIVQIILEAAGAEIQFDNYGFIEISSRRIKEFRPDLILLDLMLMRGVSGYDLFTILRMHAELKTTPIVALTASDPETEIPKAKLKGFTGFIGKPINIHLFARQIDRILRGEEVWHIA